MNLNKPLSIAEHKKASVVLVTDCYPRAAGILQKYLKKDYGRGFYRSADYHRAAQHYSEKGRSRGQRLFLSDF